MSDAPAPVDYRTDPVALPALEADVRRRRSRRWRWTSPRTRGIRPGYKLKLNSYDLGVDIELHDALQRIRFEHPEVRTVVVTSAQGPHLLLGRQHLHARPVAATRGR